MRSQAIDDLVAAAFHEAAPSPPKRLAVLRQSYPEAYGFLQHGKNEIVLFQAVGDHFADVDIKAIKRAAQAGLVPAIVMIGNGYRAVGPHFRTLKAHVVCDIGGAATIIPPILRVPRRNASPPISTRVPASIIADLSRRPELNALATDLGTLAKAYKRIARRKVRDNPEAEALMEFARLRLIALGLEPHLLEGTAFIRSLEQAGLGGRRDHFFHSFQNYMLGLQALATCSTAFEGFKDAAHVHYNVDPFAVWFLCAMWHDIGYAHERVDSFLDATYGGHLDSSVAHNVRAAFVQQEKTSQGIRCIASLMARLLNPSQAKTEWTAPSDKTKLNETAQAIVKAMVQNMQESHGAFGGVRLYRDYEESINSMEEDQRAIAQQTVLLAAVSMPFHDWKFRQTLRKLLGRCTIPTHTLPFAALLAFVDSIQDDRRDLEGVFDTPIVLKSLDCSTRGRITADVDLASLDSRATLEKIIEGRDVHASLVQDQQGLTFVYPSWVIGQ